MDLLSEIVVDRLNSVDDDCSIAVLIEEGGVVVDHDHRLTEGVEGCGTWLEDVDLVASSVEELATVVDLDDLLVVDVEDLVGSVHDPYWSSLAVLNCGPVVEDDWVGGDRVVDHLDEAAVHVVDVHVLLDEDCPLVS